MGKRIGLSVGEGKTCVHTENSILLQAGKILPAACVGGILREKRNGRIKHEKM
jgi:hypothetical protein